jgi:hypothetical protein
MVDPVPQYSPFLTGINCPLQGGSEKYPTIKEKLVKFVTPWVLKISLFF